MKKAKNIVFVFLPLISLLLILICSPDQAAMQRNMNFTSGVMQLGIGLIIYAASVVFLFYVQKSSLPAGYIWCGLFLSILAAFVCMPFIPIPMNSVSVWISSRYNPFLPGLAFSYAAFFLAILAARFKKS